MRPFSLAVLVFLFISSTALSANGGPGQKGLDDQPERFQLVLTAMFEDQGGFSAIPDTYVIDANKTAVLEYVTCRAARLPGGDASDNYNFRLIVDIQNGTISEMVILASDMEELEALTPSPVTYESSFDLISACIGKDCNSLGDGDYVSLTLKADRSRPDADVEYVHCMVSGFIY